MIMQAIVWIYMLKVIQSTEFIDPCINIVLGYRMGGWLWLQYMWLNGWLNVCEEDRHEAIPVLVADEW